MKYNRTDYSLFFKFIRTFGPAGFREIDTNHPVVLELEAEMENNNQFFYIADVIQIKILFTSKRSAKMIGTEPDKVTPETFFEVRHPDEADKHTTLRGKVFKTAHDLYNSGKGEMLMSCCTRMRNHQNKYVPLLIQSHSFYTEIPTKTVYLLNVYTEVDRYPKTVWAHHHYFGNDLAYFRYPDEKLLQTGNLFSDREFEIIQLLAKGLNSVQIGEKLYLSPNTVNTHRSNILQKSGKANMHELISWLTDLGRL